MYSIMNTRIMHLCLDTIGIWFMLILICKKSQQISLVPKCLSISFVMHCQFLLKYTVHVAKAANCQGFNV